MCNHLAKKLLYMAAGAALLCSAATARADGQGPTSGVGGDSFTRFLWFGTDGRVRLEKCNATLANCTTIDYGPVPTWYPVAYCVTNSNDSYVLWDSTTGLASIWRLDANLAFVSANLYQGPQVQGWTAIELSCDTLPVSTLRLLWKNTNGNLAIWIINRDLTVGAQAGFAQPFGWYPGDGEVTAAGAAANAKAMNAMTKLTPQQ